MNVNWDALLPLLITGVFGGGLTFFGTLIARRSEVKAKQSEQHATVEVRHIDYDEAARKELWDEIRSLRAEVKAQDTSFRAEIASLNTAVAGWQDKYLAEKEEVLILKGKIARLEVKLDEFQRINEAQARQIADCDALRDQLYEAKQALIEAHKEVDGLNLVINSLALMLETSQGGKPADSAIVAQAQSILETFYKGKGINGKADGNDGTNDH